MGRTYITKGKTVELYVSQEAGAHRAFDRSAGVVLDSVRAVANQHRLTGAYLANLRMIRAPGLTGNGRLVRDRLIVNDDPGATSIEWGRKYAKGGTVRKVPGKHIMGRGLANVPTVKD